MLPFKSFLCNFIVSVSVFGAIIIHFSRYVSFIYRTLFNSQSNPRIDSDYGTTPMSVETETIAPVLAEPISVLASNSSKFQLEQSETASSFVEELYCASSPSSGNQTLDGFEFSRGKNLWEFGLGTKECFVEVFRDEQKKGLESCEDGTVSEVLTLGEDCSLSDSDSDSESFSFDEEFIEIELELEPQLQVSDAKILPVNGWSQDGNEHGFGESKETEWDNKEMGFEEEKEEEDFLEEHQDLINQLKMELRNSRTGGLPTVLEEEGEPESICPTSVVEALKPMKNGGSFEHKEHYKEIHKVYKTYADKMRKLDIFNTQTNYAIGFVKLKDPTSSIDGRKPGIKSMLSHKLRSGRAQKGCPTLIRDLKRDLEMVYVGHLCLSWEVLHWQYRKVIQLQQNGSRQTSQYSRVVSEFQLFCILIQRFVEDERFCGPRIENYVKNRLLVRSLLQVPAIREDCVNDKKLRDKEGESTISTAALVSIIEDAMQVFREFLQTDKDFGNSGIKCAQVQLHYTDIQNPFDAQLMMMEIRTELRKKGKRLRDIVRSGNCIVKKLQRISEDGRVKNELLIGEVELKLISRVISMSRLTESQLIWCHKKLHQVNFVDRKVVVEPSFLLFPC